MSELVRTATGPIVIAQCITLDELSELAKQNAVSSRMIATDAAIVHLPSWKLSEVESIYALQGKTIHPSLLTNAAFADQEIVRLYSSEDSFLGIFRWQLAQNGFTPEKVFN
jgi:tRNA pseudouridine55 synthase